MASPFETCRQRIVRAEFHRQALTEIWNGLDTDNTYVSSTKIEEDGTGEFFITPVNRDWLAPFSLQFGEMLYQLRGALDSCVYDAAVLSLKQDPPPDEQKWNFPINIDPKEVENLMSRMKKLPNDVRFLIESVQPGKGAMGFNQGNTWDIGLALDVLNSWARIDRHRKLHLVGTAITDGNLRIILSDGMALEYCNFVVSPTLEGNSKIADFKIANFTRGSKITMNPKFTFNIAIDEAPRSLIDDVSVAMILSVGAVMEKFMAHFEIS